MADLVNRNSPSVRRLRQMTKSPWRGTKDPQPWGKKTLYSRPSNDNYRDNYDEIFGKKEEPKEELGEVLEKPINEENE